MTPFTQITGDKPVAIVTGGTKRVGAATVRALAAAGCDVVITQRGGNASDGASAVHAASVELDLSDLAAVERVGRELAHALPRVDVLVHNASVYAPTPLLSVSADEALAHYRVNALAPLLLSRTLAPRLSASALTCAGPGAGGACVPIGGAIVCMCDIHAMGETGRPRREFSAYSMSKAALLEMMLVLARELAPRVRVNAVAPGVVAFPDTGHESDAAAQARYLARVPLGRSGTPEEAAAAVRWLALEAGYCTGQVIRVDGGRALT
ncbi:MAG: SDR family oxidoreductase [Phycisphaerales bacterium]